MLEYINNPNIAIINVLSDGWDPVSCSDWGNEGLIDFPIIVDDYENYINTIGSWFGVSNSSPWYLFIDHNFDYYHSTQDINEVRAKLEEMLLLLD